MTRRAGVTLAAVALGAGVFVSGAKAAPPLCGSNQCAEEIAAACVGLSGADFRACKKFVLDQCKLSGETFCSCTNPALPPCPTCPPATAAYCGAADCGEAALGAAIPPFRRSVRRA